GFPPRPISRRAAAARAARRRRRRPVPPPPARPARAGTGAVLRPPALRRARGRIVMVSTIGVRFSPPFAGPLDAAKAALTALGEALRQELAPWGIRVVLVEPATINSGAADKVTRDAAAAMAAADPGARALYESTFAGMLQVMERREANGSPPGVAAVTITKALTAR